MPASDNYLCLPLRRRHLRSHREDEIVIGACLLASLEGIGEAFRSHRVGGVVRGLRGLRSRVRGVGWGGEGGELGVVGCESICASSWEYGKEIFWS